jgi:hypothetical protein
MLMNLRLSFIKIEILSKEIYSIFKINLSNKFKMQNLIFLIEKSVFKVMSFNRKIFISKDLSKSVLIIIKEVLIKTMNHQYIKILFIGLG